eukprot:SAG11_NODE_17809_length_508_cov_1.002445_1_plen_69_part_10
MVHSRVAARLNFAKTQGQAAAAAAASIEDGADGQWEHRAYEVDHFASMRGHIVRCWVKAMTQAFADLAV